MKKNNSTVMKNLLLSILFFAVIFLMATGCKKNNNGSGYDIAVGSLTTSPVDTNVIAGLVPLGNLNPPGHTFPTDHMYFYYRNPGIGSNIFSPGNLHLFQIARFRKNPGTPGETTDYSISFGNQSTTVLYFSHLSALSTALITAADGFAGASCDTYSTGGNTFEFCRKQVSLDITAGDIIGTGNTIAGQFALDMGLTVNNIAVCPLDYFDAASQAKLMPKLGSSDGTVKRTVAPLCGEINQDIAGTLQGNWYKQGLPKSPEDNHIAFVKDNIVPSIQRISIGSAVPGLAADVYTFTPLATGNTDRKFADVTNNGQVYCYTPKYYYGAPVANTSIIVKLESNTSLSFEKRNCDCSCNTPYSFTAAKINYVRD